MAAAAAFHLELMNHHTQPKPPASHEDQLSVTNGVFLGGYVEMTAWRSWSQEELRDS